MENLTCSDCTSASKIMAYEIVYARKKKKKKKIEEPQALQNCPYYKG